MFSEDVLLRLGIALVLMAAGLGAWILMNRLLLKRAGEKARVHGEPGVITILYFTTPMCAPCRTYQRPALERVKQALGERLKVVEVDASVKTELAGQWGVLSVPTTFVLDVNGQALAVNHGLASAEKLIRQAEGGQI